MKKKLKFYIFTFLFLNSIVFSQKTETNRLPPGGGELEIEFTYFRDLDDDSYGNRNVSITTLNSFPPSGYVMDDTDCDDSNPSVSNYNITYYFDEDRDGFGISTTTIVQSCFLIPPKFYVLNGDDCDDLNYLLNPNTAWYYDTNSDGLISATENVIHYGCYPPNENYINSLYQNFNWSQNIVYDFNDNILNSSRVYYDDLGRSNLTLSKDFLNDKMWASETVYDDFGRVSKTSFPVISSDNGFNKIGLLSPSYFSSLIFGIDHGYYPYTTDLIDYYSNSNTLNPYQATATQPYTEVEYDKLNPDNVIRTFGGNKNGTEIFGSTIVKYWATDYSFTTPAAQEMYYAFGFDYFDGQVVSGLKEVITKFYKTTIIDPHGIESVVFTDGEGKTLATARSSGSSMQYPVISTIGTQGYIDVYIPSSTTPGTLIGSVSNYKVYNLKTGDLISPTPATLASGNAYRVEAINIPSNDSKTYINVTTGGVQAQSGALGIQYEVNYYDYSLNYYDKVDRLIRTIQPNGFDFSGIDSGVALANPSHTFASTYTYDVEDQLIMTSSPDEGVSKYAYRKDGALRFSQNAIQAPLNKVSYIEYDQYGRVIENGIISGINWTNINNYVDVALPTGPTYVKSDQTFIVYDYDGNYQGVTPPANNFASFGLNPITYKRNNLAGNVVTSYTNETSSWYSYDIYGRVEWMVQNINGLGLKTIHYNYDANGNVKKVIYQNDSTTEKFEHVYTYNSNSQLIKVETASNGGTLITNAEYTYYIDGSLKRTNIANGLQGLDYVYTLGGMLKSINHPSLLASNDPGGDSNDVFGLMLDYYDDDYSRPSKPQINTFPSVSGVNTNNYDGNIKAIRYANRALDLTGSIIEPKAFVYNYNDKRWLTNAMFGKPNSTSGLIVLDASNKYNEGNINYDANGNITTLTRRNATGVANDILSYTYNSGKNQLNRVADSGVATPTDLTDLENQSVNNYGYNAIGQMTSNAQENLTYEYNALGLVSKVKKSGNTLVEFYYNERGERYKKVAPSTSGPVTEYYINDVSGTSMAIYKQQTGLPQLKELTVYGGERLGVFTVGSSSFYQYEIADHLGNVRAVIRQPLGGGTTPTINSYADYYPFGELLPGRNVFSNYRYAFQGQELDPETGMEAFKLRLWDGRIGRWLSPDPYGQFYSPYLGMGNNPIGMIDLDGGISFGFDHFKFYKGFGKGVWGGLKGLGKSLYYLGDTAEGLVQFGLTGLASSGPNPYMSTLGFDSIFGTHTNQNYMDMNNKLSKFGNDLISSNPETSGEAWGNLAFSLLGTKGLGTLTKTKTVINVSSKTKNVVNLTNKADDVITVYRGVNSNGGQAYTNALNGIVKPRGGVFGHSNPITHNSGLNGTLNSKFTSWTTDIEVAKHFAYWRNGEGVLLEMTISKSILTKSPNLKSINLFQNPGTIVSESEWLFKGGLKNLNFTEVKF